MSSSSTTQERQGPAPWLEVRRGTLFGLVIGIAAVGAAVLYAGAGAVASALQSLRMETLLLLVLVHVPIVALMGCAWWLTAGDDPPAPRWRFLWARFVRDAAAELLPVLQFGGVLFGLRALGQGRALTVGAVSASIDGVIELAAKLPYVLAALLALLALPAQSRLPLMLSLALAATALAVAILLSARRPLTDRLEAIVRAVAARWPAMLAMPNGAADPQVRASFERILKQRDRLWSGFALHLGCWCLGAGEVWITFRVLGFNLTLAQALAVDGTVAGLRTFSFMVPAAAGVQEASYLLAAAVCGVAPAAVLAASFARRARDLLLGVATLSIGAVGGAALYAPKAAELD
jgi:putative membrane protein